MANNAKVEKLRVKVGFTMSVRQDASKPEQCRGRGNLFKSNS